MRQWKVAISLALVAAVAAPFVSGTWKARAISERWVPLTEEYRQNLENEDKQYHDCIMMDPHWGEHNASICDRYPPLPLKKN